MDRGNPTTVPTAEDVLADIVQPAMDRFHVPGVAIAIVDGDAWSVHCYGTTAGGDRRPVTAETPFQLGGITKAVTATAALVLARQSALALDEPVSHLLRMDATDDGRAPVTVRLLLSHHAGLADDPLVVDLHKPPRDAAAPLLAAPKLVPPGLAYSYSNAGYGVLGAAIEAASGRPFVRAIEALVLEPAGMGARFGRGGDAGDAGPSTSIDPALGLAASANDLVAFATAVLGSSAGPGPVAAVQPEMRRPAGRADGPFHSVGLGWYTRHVGDTLLCQHGGGDRDHGTLLVLVPDRRLGVAVLTNAIGGNRFKGDVVRAVLDARGIDLGGPVLVEPDWDVGTYAGRYEDPQRGVRVDVERDVVRVRVRTRTRRGSLPPPPGSYDLTLGFYERDRAVDVGRRNTGLTGECEFVRHDGEPRWVRVASRLARRVS